jgi:hypothetical protein
VARLLPCKRGFFDRKKATLSLSLSLFMVKKKLESYAEYYCPQLNYVVEFHVR